MRLLSFIFALVLAALAPAGSLRAAPAEPVPAVEGATTTVAPAEATAAAPAAGRGLPQAAQGLVRAKGLITNSMLVTWMVALGLIVFARYATREIQDVPGGAQNFWEWLVEGLYTFLESVLGASLVKKTFWFLATLFIFILFTNWFGLIPGVGTIGWGVAGEHGFEVTRPLLRGGNADLNLPFAMSMIFFALWIIWAFQVNGARGVALHIFGPKGDLTGAIKLFMILVFFFVGFLEIISICFRPIALTFRLYGNIFAGENLLESMSHLIQHPAWARAVFSVLLPVPFYFMELLVGFVQALVFMLLCAVFTAVICTHEEEHGEAQH